MRMYFKRLNYLILITFVSILGCEKQELETPTACFTIRDDAGVTIEDFRIQRAREVTFVSCSEADYTVYYTGEEGSVWGDYPNPDNQGENSSTGDYSTVYNVPGNYVVTMVCTNRESKDEFKRAEYSQEITVYDNNTELENFGVSIDGNITQGIAVPDGFKISVPLGTDVSNLPIHFTTSSDYSKVFFNQSELISAESTLDFTASKTVVVEAHDGSTKEYIIRVIIES